jgi:hypothetical protein
MRPEIGEMATPVSTDGRSQRFPLLRAILVGAAVIAGAWHGQLTANLHSEYFNIACALVSGQGFANAVGAPVGPTAWMPPLMPGLQALLLWIGDGDRRFVVGGLVVLHVGVLAATGVLVLALACQTTRRLGANAATAVFCLALLNHYWYWFQVAHDCWLTLLFLDLVVAGFCWLHPLSSWPRAVAWGLFGGLCALASPAVGLPWGVLSLVLGWRRRALTRTAATMFCAGLALAPWTIRNYLTFGRFIPVKSNLAYELFQSQCLQADGLLQASTFKLHPNNPGSGERHEYQRLGETAYLDLKWRQFRNAVATDPQDFASRVAARFLGATVWYVPFNRTWEARRPWLLWSRRLTHPLPFIAVLFLLAAAMHGPLPSTHWMAIAVYLLYLLPYVAASYYERYAVPMLTVKVMLVIWALEHLLSHRGRLWLRHFVGVDDKFLEVRGPERGGYRHVHGVPTAGHQHSADPRRVVPGVEREPPAVEVRLEPTAEVHRARRCGHADVAEVAGRIPRRNAQAPAKGQGQVIKVAAYTRPLLVDVVSTLERTGELVAKLDVAVYPVADGLHPRPAKPGLAEERPGNVREFIDVTVPAAQ